MAIGSEGLRPSDLDAMDDIRLAQELEKAKAELFNLRFSQATGQLEDHGRVLRLFAAILPVSIRLRVNAN